MGTILTQALAQPRSLIVLLLTGAVVTFLYSLLLPFQYTQRLSPANWHYLNAELATFSAIFGLLMGVIVTLQVYATGEVAERRRGRLSALAIIPGLLPTMLCCTPVVPTILALIGLSTAGIYGTSGLIQSFFAREETYFLLATLGLLGASILWSLHVLRAAPCRDERGCER